MSSTANIFIYIIKKVYILNNSFDNITEITIHNLHEPMINLPLCLKKIKFLKIYDPTKRDDAIEQIKILFGCEIEYVGYTLYDLQKYLDKLYDYI